MDIEIDRSCVCLLCHCPSLFLCLQMAALRSRGRGEAARGAALAIAGGPSEPTEQQQLLARVSCSHVCVVLCTRLKLSWACITY